MMTDTKTPALSAGELCSREYQPDVLNILRVLATLFVFFLHGIDSLEGSKELTGALSFLIATPAWAGVWIFLFLSGFLFGYGACRGRYPFAGQCHLRDLGRFYLSRFLRLAPLYYAYIIFYEFFSGQFALCQNPTLLLRMLTFTFNGERGADGFGHLWYISLAMQLYLLMPLLFFLLEKLRRRSTLTVVLVGVTLAGLALRLALYSPMTQEWYREVYTFVGCNLDFICAGMLCALLLFRRQTVPAGTVEPGFPRLYIKYLSRCGAVLLFGALVVYNCYIYYNGVVARYVRWMTDTYCFLLPTAYIVACSLLVLVFSGRERKLRRGGRGTALLAHFFLLINRFSVNSYGFYIFHIAVFAYLRGSLLRLERVAAAPFALRYVLFYLTAFLLSLGLSLLFRRGGDAWLRAVREKREKSPATAEPLTAAVPAEGSDGAVPGKNEQ